MPLAGRPLVEWSLAALRASPSVGAIVVACPPGHEHGLSGEGAVPGGERPAPGEVGAGDPSLVVVDGGASRSRSVANALAAVETELVAIHDAARPLLTPELVEGVVATLAGDPRADAAIAATPVVDTIKRAAGPAAASPGGQRQLMSRFPAHRVVKATEVESTVDRECLWAAQTPQAFRTAALREALDAYPADAPQPTDEAMLIEAAGGTVLIHPAPAANLKVTTPLDLRLAELLLSER